MSRREWRKLFFDTLIHGGISCKSSSLSVAMDIEMNVFSQTNTEKFHLYNSYPTPNYPLRYPWEIWWIRSYFVKGCVNKLKIQLLLSHTVRNRTQYGMSWTAFTVHVINMSVIDLVFFTPSFPGIASGFTHDLDCYDTWLLKMNKFYIY